MNKILVPLDGSELAESSLEVAEKMMGPGMCLVLLQVFNPVEGILQSDAAHESDRYLHSVLDSWCDRHPNSDLRILVREGLAAQSIIEIAEEERAGLIVMTTHGKGGLTRWLMGSVAERVVRHAPCPVLTIGKRSLESKQKST